MKRKFDLKPASGVICHRKCDSHRSINKFEQPKRKKKTINRNRVTSLARRPNKLNRRYLLVSIKVPHTS